MNTFSRKSLLKNAEVILIFTYLVFTIIIFRFLQDIKGLSISFSLFSVALILFKRDIFISDKISFWFPIIIFLLIVSVQYVLFDTYFSYEFFQSLSWLICPLFIYLTGKKRLKLFYILSFLWLVNVLSSFYQLSQGRMVVGLPGNWNWNASLILGISPVVMYILRSRIKNYQKPYLFNYLILSVVVFFIYKTGSRGAFVSFFTGALLYLYFYTAKSTKHRKIFIYSAVCVLLTGAGIFYLLFDYFIWLMQYDTRIPMWRGAIRLIIENSLLGVGDNSYLSAYTAFRPTDYFLRSHHFAHITEHPHNHFLYMLGSFGLFGGSAILFLSLYPVFICLRKFYNLSSGGKAILFSSIFFLVCSFFDMTYYHWHNYFAITVILGLLWRAVYIPSIRTDQTGFSLIYFFRAATAVFVFIIFVQSNITIFKINRYYNAGQMIGDKYEFQSQSIHLFDQTGRVYPNFSYSFSSCGFISMQDFRDPVMADYYFSKMQDTPNPNISRSNLRMADAKFAIGRKKEVLYYLNKDLKNYPVSLETLFKKLKLEEELGMKDEMKKTSETIAEALKYKGLEWEDLPVVAKNPYFDNKFEEYKLLKKRILQEKEIEKNK